MSRRIVVSGGAFGTAFIRCMAALTGTRRPRLCYLPTAAADRPDDICVWYRNCAPLDVIPFVQETFISSFTQHQGWDEVLLSMDGIVASGGNTVNQQAIWKATASTWCSGRRGSEASCSAAPAPARCAGSKKGRPTRGPRSSRW